MIAEALEQFPEKELFVEAIRKRTYETEIKCHGCAQVIVQTFLDTLGQENTALSMSASPFAAGMALTGNNCGALIGGLMVLGLFYGREDINQGMAGILKGIRPMRKFVKYFEGKEKHVNCRDITGTDLADPAKATAYFEQGGLEKCATMMAEAAAYVAGMVYDDKNNL
jgi:C_GCAxxG_C_C family probable redox protein